MVTPSFYKTIFMEPFIFVVSGEETECYGNSQDDQYH